ncbi:hypothetical protein HDU67_000392 [Dinochytrium kinnereticum]|nr:hypothetical protein HDU67_000392 [Dinochytrium kinnereticum]
MSQDEEDLLLSQYTDEVTQTVNYFKMNTDVNRKERKERRDDVQLVKRSNPDYMENEHVPVGTEELLHAVGAHTSPNQTIREMQMADCSSVEVYKDRIRLIEFFKDYDRHNYGYVSVAQFHAGIRLAELKIDGIQVKTLVEAYKNPKNNMVGYRKFCNDIDTVFTVSNLEKNPTADVQPPPREYLIQGCNELSPVEEARCREIITRFRQIINERRLLLAPYFKDFEKYLGNMGRVTRSHFSRLLSTMKLDVSDNDLHILFKKFEDRQQAKVVYMEFIRTIDPTTYGSIIKKIDNDSGISTGPSSQEPQPASTEEIMDRLRIHVGTQRIRVAEFFKDFDKLRCYSIPKHEFIRAINMIGVTLAEEEYEALAEKYKDGLRKGCCLWKEFELCIEKVFNDTDLERHPTKPHETASIPKSPFGAVGALTAEEELTLRTTLKSIAEHMKVRQTSIKPFFKDFDKLYTGHVTKTQFRQCLTYLQVNVTDFEFEVLCKRWSKSLLEESSRTTNPSDPNPRRPPTRDPIKDGAERICYLTFLAELDEVFQDPPTQNTQNPSQSPVSPLENKVLRNRPGAGMIPAGISTTGKVTKEKEGIMAKLGLLGPEDVQMLMMKIRSKARTERIRVIDFMQDFDHLRHGKITRNEFRRALKVLYLDLSEVELATLESLYQNPKDTNLVDYLRFSDDVESVFTSKGLEKEPTREPELFDGFLKGADPSLNKLAGAHEERILENVVGRLREKIRQRRIDILSYMEDYDFVKEGTITTNQFRSVLNTNNLPIDDSEIRVLARRFTVDSNLDRVNYRAIAAAITGKDGLPKDLSGVTRIRKGRTGVEGAVGVPVNTFGIW